jgi:hypothetical protein
LSPRSANAIAVSTIATLKTKSTSLARKTSQ